LSRAIREYAGCDLLDDSAQSLLYGHLLDTIARLRGEVSCLRRENRKPPPDCLVCAKKVIPVIPVIPVTGQVEKPPVRLQILHRIVCRNHYHNHNYAIFEDEPSRRGSLHKELRGEKRITDIKHHCAQHTDISFILLKEHNCTTNDSVSEYDPMDRERFRISNRNESLLIVSDVLQKALNQVALCSPPDTKEHFVVPQMHAPYLFLYHHKTLLSDLAATTGGETEEHISLLLAFLNEHYRDEYEEADSQFGAGIVSRKHFEKLYRPNSIVIDKNGPQDRAYVVKSWLKVEKTDLRLPCWSWEYDGSFLSRKDIVLEIDAPSDDSSSLSSVGIYPISMVDDECLENLRQRGRKFWSMKGQYFTCYSGYNINRTQFYVSTRYHLAFSIY
jgi:hypothetical protein